MLRNVLCEELPQTRHHYGVLFNRTRLSLICLLFFLSGATKFLSMMVAWAVQYTMCYCRHKRIKRQNTHTKYVNSSICVRLGLSPFCVNYHLPPYSTAVVVVRIIIACLNVWIFSYISWDIKQCVPFGRRSNANSGFWFCSRLWFPELCIFSSFLFYRNEISATSCRTGTFRMRKKQNRIPFCFALLRWLCTIRGPRVAAASSHIT